MSKMDEMSCHNYIASNLQAIVMSYSHYSYFMQQCKLDVIQQMSTDFLLHIE